MSFTRPEVLMPLLAPVVAQDDLKRKLSSAVSQYTRFLEDPAVGRPIVCVYGPSGAGKTFAVETLARGSNLSFTSVSGASIAVVSYKGLTLREVLFQHYLTHKTDTGVIFLDEIDKWCAGAMGVDTEIRTMGLKVQAELLRLLEAEEVVFQEEAEDLPEMQGVRFNTQKIAWVLAGAFVRLDAIIRKRLHNTNLPPDETWKWATPSDFVNYGMLPELAGRMSTWAWVNPLKQMEMVRIVKEQEVPRWIALFKNIDCDLTIDDGALGRAAETAFFEHTGARGAISFLRRSMEDLYYEASNHHLPTVHVDARLVITGRLEVMAGGLQAS